MPPSALVELLALAVELQTLLLGEALAPSPASISSSLRRRCDRVGDRLPVGQHAAEPAGVDVILGRTLGGVGDDVGRLALGADEQHAAALGDGVGDLLQCLVQQRHGLRQVDDVDVVAGAVDVVRHLRVPAVGLVAEVNASFQKLAHGEVWQSHLKCSFPVGLHGRRSSFRRLPLNITGGRLRISPGRKPSPCVEWPRI